VRVHNAEAAEVERYAKKANDVFSRSVDVGLASAWFEGAVNLASMASLVAVLGFGGSLVASQ
jgi:ABC-type multidrug transport system fused ATPase/permease subunit